MHICQHNQKTAGSSTLIRPSLLSKPRYFVFSDYCNEPAGGIRLDFKDVAQNGADDDITTRPQYFVDVVNAHERQVMFVVSNLGSCTSSISDIYFDGSHSIRISVQIIADEAARKGDSCIHPDSGFRETCLPDALHDSNTYQCTRRLPAGSNTGSACDGIGFGETLGIVFDLQAGVTMCDIVNALHNETFNIGIKVQDDLPGDGRILINDPGLHMPLPLNLPKFTLS